MLAVLAVAEIIAAASQSPIALETKLAATPGIEEQWMAFRALAAPDAMLFLEPNRPGPFKPSQLRIQKTKILQPHRAFTACDGSLVVTSGAVTWSDHGHGRYRTVWRRGADGRWLWVLHGRWEMGSPYINNRDGPPHPTCPTSAPSATINIVGERGGSQDGSLRWAYLPKDGGIGGLSINAWVQRGYLAVLNDSVAFAPLKVNQEDSE